MQPIDESRPWLDEIFDQAWSEGGTYEEARDRVIQRLEATVLIGDYLIKNPLDPYEDD